MKNKKLFADGGLTLIQLFDRFGTDDKARKHLEGVLWKQGIVCPHCQNKDQNKFGVIKANPAAKTREGLRWCGGCKKPFTVTIGTVFEDSKIPLRKWLIAWYMLCSSKKGISSGIGRMPTRDESAFGRRGRQSEMKRSLVRRPECVLVTATRRVVPDGEINQLTQDVRH